MPKANDETRMASRQSTQFVKCRIVRFRKPHASKTLTVPSVMMEVRQQQVLSLLASKLAQKH